MSKYSDNVQALLARPMTRQQFLATLGLFVVSLFGLGEVFRMLDKGLPGVSSDPTVYGFGDYSEYAEG